MNRLIIASILSSFLLSSCHGFFQEHIHGDGNIKNTTRNVGSFARVDVSGGDIHVIVRHDSVQSVSVEADGNLLEYIETTVEGDKLYIHERDGINVDPTREIKVYVSSPNYKSFEASGNCQVNSANQINAADGLEIDLSGNCQARIDLKSPSVRSDLSGNCYAELRGATKDFKIGGSGNTEIKSMDLMAENVDVDISGSGYAEVFASVKLNISVSGSGDIKYKGNAALSQEVSGSGSVQKVD